jgi:2-iminobutanoate/2-iminopropanoate deaminase
MNSIEAVDAPAPGGHYAQALVHNGVVYVSGQLPIEPGTGRKLSDAPVEEQTERVLRNIAAILRAAGSDVDRVLKTTVYVSDIALWDRVNTVYAAFFGSHRPTRAVVPTRDLHFGFLVEIDAVAAVRA